MNVFNLEKAEKLLQTYYGYPSFRPGQLEVIKPLVNGRDALAIMPTGAGKSICYQIPALMLEGITIVISPLVSLMKDQVNTLNSIGIRAAFLNSSLTPAQYRKALGLAANYTYKIIYVAPERLLTDSFVQFVKSVHISLVAVDEAHCVSQWGQNFRPAYTDIPKFMELFEERPIMAALTATATPLVRQDILSLTGLKNPKESVTGYDRPNLYFEVQHPRNKDQALMETLNRFKGSTGIVYCLTRKQTDEVYDRLIEAGYPAAKYHAGLCAEDRRQAQDDFVYDRAQIMVATSAFGMGIDKSNVRYVIHYSMPSSLESYYQEAGRAGRDGLESSCILFYSPKDFHTCKFFLEQSGPNENLTESQQQSVAKMDWIRLCRMRDYCFHDGCLRQYILRYFGESGDSSCQNCSNCLEEWETTDITQQCQQILQCILKLPRSYGAGMIRDVLRGAATAKIKNAYLDQNPYYGVLKAYSAQDIMDFLEQMILDGWLERSLDFYQTISPVEGWQALMAGKAKVEIRRKKNQPAKTSGSSDRRSRSQILPESVDKEMFEKLRMLRKTIAAEEHVPPYIVFGDKTLQEMASRSIRSADDLLQVSGVGQHKLSKYGKRFLAVLTAHDKKC